MDLLKFLFGDDLRSRAQRNQFNPGVGLKNLISPINNYGTCFACDGQGQRLLECGACTGRGKHSKACGHCTATGTIILPAKPCFRCRGSGKTSESACLRCSGTSQFKPELRLTCRKCSGTGQWTESCRKCQGQGRFTVACRKCSGSGWFKQGRRS